METATAPSDSKLTASVTVWLGIVSTALTLGLTGLNAYWSKGINETDQRLKARAAELEEKKLELERLNVSLTEGKDRMARYAFVQGLFSKVLNENDVGEKTLAVNLINLALDEKEATRLFAGLQTSKDKGAREVGQIGTDLIDMTNLVLQMNAATKESRVGAVDKLIRNYRADPRAIDQAIRQIEMPLVAQLSGSGRINVLVFLRSTDRAAWSAELADRAHQSINGMKRGQFQMKAEVGQQTLDELNKLDQFLNKPRA